MDSAIIFDRFCFVAEKEMKTRVRKSRWDKNLGYRWPSGVGAFPSGWDRRQDRFGVGAWLGLERRRTRLGLAGFPLEVLTRRLGVCRDRGEGKRVYSHEKSKFTADFQWFWGEYLDPIHVGEELFASAVTGGFLILIWNAGMGMN